MSEATGNLKLTAELLSNALFHANQHLSDFISVHGQYSLLKEITTYSMFTDFPNLMIIHSSKLFSFMP